MYKTFIRPTAEYGLSIACMAQNPSATPVTSAFNQLQSDSANWILPGNKNMLKVKLSLLGMGHASYRIVELQGGFIQQLDKMPPTNPLHILSERLTTHLQGFRRIINRLKRVPEYYTWKRLNNTRRPEARTLWRTHIRSKAISDMTDSKLIAYIAPYARKKHSLCDPAILDSDKHISILATTWRLNLLSGKICGKCHKPLTRQHAESCITLPPELSFLMATKFDRDKTDIAKSHPRIRDIKYTALDFLLNQKLMKEFQSASAPILLNQAREANTASTPKNKRPPPKNN